MHTPPKYRVLIFPCGTEIGLEIQRALAFSAHVEILGASSIPSNHGPYVFKHYHANLPFVHEPNCMEALAALVEKERVDLLFPAHDDVALALARSEEDFAAKIVGSPLPTNALCRSKTATYRRFANLLPVPFQYNMCDREAPVPLFLKPDAGQGSRGTRLAHTRESWENALQEDPTIIALEHLPGPEYTVDCFTDRHGGLRFSGPRERVRTANGISMHTRPLPRDRFRDAALIINDTLELRGPWFFQMKENAQGVPTLLEIAPRVSGGMGLYRNLGVNFPLLGVYDRLDMDVEISPSDAPLEMDRALISRFRSPATYRHVYIDLDDTIIQQGCVNPMMIAFLFQCRNRGVSLHLLTRHADTPEETLKRHALFGLFDTVVHITDGSDKAAFIQHSDAIFVEDSYRERVAVREQIGIEVFAPDAVESLLDWRA